MYGSVDKNEKHSLNFTMNLDAADGENYLESVDDNVNETSGLLNEPTIKKYIVPTILINSASEYTLNSISTNYDAKSHKEDYIHLLPVKDIYTDNLIETTQSRELISKYSEIETKQQPINGKPTSFTVPVHSVMDDKKYEQQKMNTRNYPKFKSNLSSPAQRREEYCSEGNEQQVKEIFSLPKPEIKIDCETSMIPENSISNQSTEEKGELYTTNSSSRTPNRIRKLSPAHVFELIRKSPGSRTRKGKNQKRKNNNMHLNIESNEDLNWKSDLHRKSIFEAMEERFKNQARIELLALYSQYSIPFPISWLKNNRKICIEDIFVEPYLTFNKNKVKLEELLIVQPNKISQNPLRIIKGPPGSGKTAIYQYITYCWRQEPTAIKTLNEFDLLFAVECKYVKMNELMSTLKEIYLKESWSYLPNTSDNEYFFKILNSLKILILLDGFDEGQKNCRELLKRLRSRLPDSKIIITTRIRGIKDIQETLALHSNYDTIEFIVGKFDDEKFVHLVVNLSNVFEQTDEKQFQLLGRIERQFDNVGSFLRLPLYIILYIVIWVHQEPLLDKIQSTTDLLLQLIELMKKQLFPVLGLRKYADVNRANELLNIWFMEFGKVSLYCIEAKQFYFSPVEYEEIRRLCCELNFNNYIAVPVIMQQVSHLPVRNLRVFFHTTIMEFLAALYMDRAMASSDLGFFQLLNGQSIDNKAHSSCVCIPFQIRSSTFTNVAKLNFQQDNAVEFLVSISQVNNHSSLNFGYDVATYFPLSFNRNLPILSRFTYLFNGKDDPFRRGLRIGLANQKLPNPINNWNMKHVMNLIRTDVLKSTIHIQFAVEHNDNWGPTVNDLVNFGCRPYIEVILEQKEQMQALITALDVIEHPKVPKLILHFGLIDVGITELVERWPFPTPMHILGLEGRYAIEAYFACVAIVNTIGLYRVDNVVFAGDESCYVFESLKKSLRGVAVHLQPTDNDSVHIVITTKK